jgi:HAD superfamily hydrolase (TIGR01549 family)
MRTGWLAALDFGGTLDGTGLSPRERRWAFYTRVGLVFPRERLISAHVASRERICNCPDTRTWPLARSARMWFVFETQILNIPEASIEAWTEEFVQDELTRLRAAKTVLETLAQHYTLAVISNNIGNLHLILQEAEIDHMFACIVDSTICGYRKPDPNIFKYCQEQLEIADPRNCWYLGDSWKNDVLGAQAANWNPVLFSPQILTEQTGLNVPLITSLENYASFLDERKESLLSI